LTLKPFPYYDKTTCSLSESAMLEALSSIPKGDLVLLHACCHNPSGVDPTHEQWKAIADVIVERELVPLVDMAYQGFGDGLHEDAFIIRHLKERVPEMIVCNSCSKNFGLYRDRVGAISVMLENKAQRAAVQSQANTIVRTLYSMPPDHGAAVVSLILHSESLSTEWRAEVDAMRARITGMRELLYTKLLTAAPSHDFSHLARAKGMFCFLGISAEQVERLKKDHGVYMVNSSRINVAGITETNVDYLAASIAAVL
jgi:aspartate/tyrosine/aromatic aminotransferase